METFGMTAAEAAACARPVIAFATGGLPEIVEAGVNGWLLPLESRASGLAKALERSARDRQACVAMGLEGRLKAEALFSIQTSAKQYLQIYSPAGGSPAV